MGEAKFTPGPWSASSVWSNFQRDVYAGRGVGALGDLVAAGSGAIAAANARLIAAAPDLYEALNALVLNAPDIDYHPLSIFAHLVENARAALAKANPPPPPPSPGNEGGER